MQQSTLIFLEYVAYKARLQKACIPECIWDSFSSYRSYWLEFYPQVGK